MRDTLERNTTKQNEKLVNRIDHSYRPYAPTFALPVMLRLRIFVSTLKKYFRFQRLYGDVNKNLSNTKTESQPLLGPYRGPCPGIILTNVFTVFLNAYSLVSRSWH